MNLIFVTEARFIENSEGDVFADTSFGPELWERYLKEFNQVSIICRIEKSELKEIENKILVKNKKIKFLKLPYFIGPLQYLQNRRDLKERIKTLVNQNRSSSFLCRIPGKIGDMVIKELIKINKQYAVEVVGDPAEVFSKGSINHPLRRVFKFLAVNSLKNNVKNSSAALYVTNRTLQEKYPMVKGGYQTEASNVSLPDKQFQGIIPKSWEFKRRINILSIGSLEQIYKSPDILIKSLKILNSKEDENEYYLTWIGEGKFKSEMLNQVKAQGLESQIKFIGSVPSSQIKNFLIDADLFVLASRTEGLPRVIIEAMSVGLPVIGTNVGGIPELLDDTVLVEKNNSEVLAQKIKEITGQKEFYNHQAERNFNKSLDYKESLLSARRAAFYNVIKNLS